MNICYWYGFMWSFVTNSSANFPLQWCHNGCDSVSNHQPHECLLNRLFRRRSKKPSKLRITGLCAGNSPETGEFPAQMASNAENASIWWRHHAPNYPQMDCPWFPHEQTCHFSVWTRRSPFFTPLLCVVSVFSIISVFYSFHWKILICTKTV